MMEMMIYLFKVTLCSAVLFAYYLLVLRNRIFHSWNRFYLLAAIGIPLFVPLLEFNIAGNLNGTEAARIQVLQVVESTNQYLEEIVVGDSEETASLNWLLLVYTSVSLLMLFSVFRAMYRMVQLIRTHAANSIGKAKFIQSNIEGSPFSFFHYIFWNRAIDPHSPSGQQVLKHELVHVTHKHSYDKLFVEIVLVFFWCNPVFWLIRKELKMLHEFIADQKAVQEGGPESLAAMILQAAYPQQFYALTHPFYQTSIKRRLAMISKNKNPRISYFSRLFVLLLTGATTLAFSIRHKTFYPPVKLNSSFTVMIDAGHGHAAGKPSGAQYKDIYEDDMVLDIARKIKELNKNSHINIQLTRQGQETVSLEDRVAMGKKAGADLFISIHMAAAPAAVEEARGIEVLVPNKNPDFRNSSELLGSAMIASLQQVYTVNKDLQTRNVGIYVLNESKCPSILIECGYINSNRDLEFMSKEKNRKAIAQKILEGISTYAITVEKEQPAKKQDPASDTTGPVFEKLENPSRVDQQAWRKFLTKELTAVVEAASKKAPAGKYTVQVKFIVEQDGSVTHIEALNDPGYGIAQDVLQVFKKSPRWTPGKQNGRVVRSYQTQPVTIVVAK